LTSSPPSSHLAVAVSAECPASPDGNYGEGLRSLWHLSRHLTARADDNHAAPSQRPRRASPSLDLSSAIQARVRFLAYHRIKPHVPPLVRAPVNSFEFHRCRRTPQVGCLTLSLGHPAAMGRTAGIHRLPRGLPGYLILFDTRAFEHQRQWRNRRLPSQSGFFVISKHFTATPRIPPTSRALKPASSRRSPAVGRRTFTARLTSGLRSL
jgi:hypothetical protein